MSKVVGVSDNELDGLSDEERGALTDTDDDAEDLGAIANGATEDDADAEAAKAEAKAQADVKAKADAAAKKREEELAAMDEEERVAAQAADKAAADAAAKKAADDAASAKAAGGSSDDDESAMPAAIPRYKVAPVEDYDGKMATINKEMADLNASFRAADIEIEDYQTKQAEIQAKRDDLLSQKIKGDLGAEFNAQAAQGEWAMQCGYFMRTVQRLDGIDYTKGTVKVDNKDVPLRGELDKMVKVLANMPENGDKSGEWFLREADSIVRARYGITGKRSEATPDPKKVAARRPDLKSVPKTLGGLPSAAGGDATDDSQGGEFAHLDKLSGMELEAAVARMTPEQQKRWEMAA